MDFVLSSLVCNAYYSIHVEGKLLQERFRPYVLAVVTKLTPSIECSLTPLFEIIKSQRHFRLNTLTTIMYSLVIIPNPNANLCYCI